MSTDLQTSISVSMWRDGIPSETGYIRAGVTDYNTIEIKVVCAHKNDKGVVIELHEEELKDLSAMIEHYKKNHKF